MKKRGLFILLLILVSCVQTPDASREQLVKIKGWKILDEANYAIQYPGTWEANQSGQMGTSFLLFSPVDSESDDFRENINLLIQDLSGRNLDLDSYTELSVKQIQTVTKGPFIANERLKNTNGDYQKLVYSGDQGIYQLVYEQYCWVINDQAYVLTFTSEQDQYQNYKKTAEKMMNSFVLKD